MITSLLAVFFHFQLELMYIKYSTIVVGGELLENALYLSSTSNIFCWTRHLFTKEMCILYM